MRHPWTSKAWSWHTQPHGQFGHLIRKMFHANARQPNTCIVRLTQQMLEIEAANQHGWVSLGSRNEVDLPRFLPCIELRGQRIKVFRKSCFAARSKQPVNFNAVPRQRDVERMSVSATVGTYRCPDAQTRGLPWLARRQDVCVEQTVGQTLDAIDNSRQQHGRETFGVNRVHGKAPCDGNNWYCATGRRV